MKTALKILALVIVIPIALGATIHFTGNTFNVIVMVFKPPMTVDTEEKAPAPDYADVANWAALPSIDDPSDLVPVGLTVRDTDAPVDVFFIHPTAFLRSVSWNSPMDPGSSTEENIKWMLANQAAAFNECCDIYAPRFREANIFAYLVGTMEVRHQALDFAYEDVERAFDYFLEHHSKGRPFIIAGHSQGTQHGLTLLKERISGTDLRGRMVAAYILGAELTRQEVDEIPDIAPCDAPDDLHCVIHWATYGVDGVSAGNGLRDGPLLCVNPLNWRDEGGHVAADKHKGAIVTSGLYAGQFWGEDVAADVKFEAPTSVVPGRTWAECKDGRLTVADQSNDLFVVAPVMPEKNYHSFDYPLFYMDIRENAQLRSQTYLASNSATEEKLTD